MQNSTSTRKWSDIQGMAAVAIDTGKKVGTIEDFYFDPQNGTLLGFLIKTGLLGHRVLKSNNINGIGIDAVTFANENALIKESAEKELSVTPLGKSLLAYRVLSEGGNVIGTIGNILLDLTTPSAIRIATFELAGGLREHLSKRYLSFDANQVTRYGHDVIVIPDTIAQSLQ